MFCHLILYLYTKIGQMLVFQKSMPIYKCSLVHFTRDEMAEFLNVREKVQFASKNAVRVSKKGAHKREFFIYYMSGVFESGRYD
jgi:hypothetical protein